MSNFKNLLEAMDFKVEFTSEEEFSLVREALRRKMDELNYVEQNHKKEELARLKKETDYVYPVFAFDEDEEFKNGSCFFSSKEQADLMLKRINSSWDTHHSLSWSGPGKYKLIPSIESDRCGDTILSVKYEIEVDHELK